jgi:hypothetical protein
MLAAQLGEKFGGGAAASDFYVFVAPANALRRFFGVLALPFEIGGQRVVKGSGRVLAVALCVFFQLGAALGFQGDHVHVDFGALSIPRLGAQDRRVKQTYLPDLFACM